MIELNSIHNNVMDNLMFIVNSTNIVYTIEELENIVFVLLIKMLLHIMI